LFVTRVLTAAVLLTGFAAALFWLNRSQFAWIALAIVGLGGYEWARLVKAGRGLAAAYGATCAGACYLLLQSEALAPWICAVAAVFWMTAAPYLLARGVAAVPVATGLTLGTVILVPPGVAMSFLPATQLLMVLGLIWISDTAAYLAGRAWGRRKLAPSISPGKTWEGVGGGAIACTIYAIIWALFDPDLRTRVQGSVWIPFIAGTLLLCALGVVGDLLESGLKRQAGVKDSGRLLPGHGGVLDRIDSATATLPVALLLLLAIGAT